MLNAKQLQNLTLCGIKERFLKVVDIVENFLNDYVEPELLQASQQGYYCYHLKISPGLIAQYSYAYASVPQHEIIKHLIVALEKYGYEVECKNICDEKPVVRICWSFS